MARTRPSVRPRCPATDELLVAAGRGDLEAFAGFYDATARTVLGLVHEVLRESARTEQVIEQVYLTLWRCAPAFDPAVRSAEATVLETTRRVLVGPVRDVVARTPARRPGDGLRTRSGVRRRGPVRGEPES